MDQATRVRRRYAFDISVGDKVQDRITGLTGIVVCVAQWLNGCKRVTVQPQEHKDGKIADLFTGDPSDMVLLQVEAITPQYVDIDDEDVPVPAMSSKGTTQPATKAATGGPMPSPTRF
jgi:hypothetical protein